MSSFIQDKLKIMQRLLNYLIDKVPLRIHMVAFVAVVLGFGCAYFLLTDYGNGLGYNSTALSDATFLKALYFSIVTVSSLGYGDIHPMGFSKALVCFEVLFGLAFLGIIIAKVTSRRLNHHVQRIFGSDAQKRLDEFTATFEHVRDELSESIKSLERAFQKTPKKNDQQQDHIAPALSSFKTTLTNLHSTSESLTKYLSYESEHGDYFAVVHADVLLRLGTSIDKGLILLGQLIISITTEARIAILDLQNRKRISDTLDLHKNICAIVKRCSKDNNLVNSFLQILDTCERVPECYFTMPLNEDQPDQVLVNSNEPKET